MAVNFVLTGVRDLPPGDSLARSWVGWKATATDDELWEVNRGLWSLGSRVDGERIATLSFDGRVQVVAEIDGRTRHDVDGVTKWALVGRVLRPGDPVHDALKGAPAPRYRNPVSYFDTARLDMLSAAERASIDGRERTTMVVTWNPERWNPDGWAENVYPRDVEAVESGRLLRDRWATGNRKAGIEPGDRIFFLRQGPEPRGIIGSGTAASRIFSAEQWDDKRAEQDANYVLIDWDTLVLPEDGLPHALLVNHIPEGGAWRPQSSGWVLPPRVAAKLEKLWADHLGHPAPLPTRGSPRQGWQLDPARRRKVEDAAQDRLMAHFRDRGWIVRDVRFGNPYDAIATRNGRTLWLEAKGTETKGAAVIVSRREVQWAREHDGDCVLGILSDVVFRPDGEVDPASGTFRVFTWNPDGGALSARDYDFTPAENDRQD
ncbi:protein NO VEIN domain-containing protein [Micromonospora chalcea]